MQIEGIVITKTNGFYYVETDKTVHECKLRGKLKRDKKNKQCIVGDRVVFDSDDSSINEVKPRTNMINRPLLANLDLLLICIAGKDPAIDFNILNLLVLNAMYYKIKPVVVINKVDLLTFDEVETLKSNLLFLENLDINYVFVSAEKKTNIEILNNLLKGKISAFAGPSGAGKSSIINLIQDEEKLETSELSRKIKRGRHTTKISKLLHLSNCNGHIADTPGFSTIELPKISSFEDYLDFFPDFKDAAMQCQFRDCIHINEPKCGVKDYVERNAFLEKRYHFYKTNYEILCERWKNIYD